MGTKRTLTREEKLEKIRNAADEKLIDKNYSSPARILRLIQASSINPKFNVSFGISSTVYACAAFDPKVDSVLQKIIEKRIHE